MLRTLPLEAKSDAHERHDVADDALHEFLHALGLCKYETLLLQNGVTFGRLRQREVAAAELKALGVAKGAQVKLMRAAATWVRVAPESSGRLATSGSAAARKVPTPEQRPPATLCINEMATAGADVSVVVDVRDHALPAVFSGGASERSKKAAEVGAGREDDSPAAAAAPRQGSKVASRMHVHEDAVLADLVSMGFDLNSALSAMRAGDGQLASTIDYLLLPVPVPLGAADRPHDQQSGGSASTSAAAESSTGAARPIPHGTSAVSAMTANSDKLSTAGAVKSAGKQKKTTREKTAAKNSKRRIRSREKAARVADAERAEAAMLEEAISERRGGANKPNLTSRTGEMQGGEETITRSTQQVASDLHHRDAQIQRGASSSSSAVAAPQQTKRGLAACAMAKAKPTTTPGNSSTTAAGHGAVETRAHQTSAREKTAAKNGTRRIRANSKNRATGVAKQEKAEAAILEEAISAANGDGNQSLQEHVLDKMKHDPDYLVPGTNDNLHLCQCPDMRWLMDVGRPQFAQGLEQARLALQHDEGVRRLQLLRAAASDIADVYLRDMKALSFANPREDQETFLGLLAALSQPANCVSRDHMSRQDGERCEFDLQVLLAMMMFATGQMPDAIAQISGLLAFPGRVEPWQQARFFELRAGFTLTTGNSSSVRCDLDRAIEINDNPGLRFQRAMTSLTLGACDTSFEDLTVYMETAHPDERHYYLMSFALALRVLHLKLRSPARDEAAELYFFSVASEKRHHFIYGKHGVDCATCTLGPQVASAKATFESMVDPRKQVWARTGELGFDVALAVGNARAFINARVSTVSQDERGPSAPTDCVTVACAMCSVVGTNQASAPDGGDDAIKQLLKCKACKMIWYCSVECQRQARLQYTVPRAATLLIATF